MMYNSNMPKRAHPPRPPGPTTRLKDAALMVRMTEEQLRQLQQRASYHNLSTSTWARMILLREAGDLGTRNDRDR